jgi:hypothetical protein
LNDHITVADSSMSKALDGAASPAAPEEENSAELDYPDQQDLKSCLTGLGMILVVGVEHARPFPRLAH